VNPAPQIADTARRVVRTVIEVAGGVVVFSSVYPYIVEALGIPKDSNFGAWLASSVVVVGSVAAAITQDPPVRPLRHRHPSGLLHEADRHHPGRDAERARRRGHRGRPAAPHRLHHPDRVLMRTAAVAVTAALVIAWFATVIVLICTTRF
jgi:hypothetical protein